MLYFAGLSSQIAPVWPVALLYQAFGYLWIFVISYDLLPKRVRKWMTIVLDFGIFSFGFATGGEAVAMVFFAPIFSAVGYALRYGLYYAHLAMLLGTPLLVVGMSLNPFWLEHPFLSAGVLTCVLILPTYVKKLSEQVIANQRHLEERAGKLQEESRRDVLTGLFNRLGFSEKIANQLDDTQPSAILYIDLDGFKNVNDIAGHMAGDKVLFDVAKQIKKALRTGDVVARLGGDEFAASVTHLRSPEDAHQVAENIIHAVSSLKVEGHDDLRLGASIGICELPSSALRDIGTALNHADALMYQAKRSGKNRFVAG